MGVATVADFFAVLEKSELLEPEQLADVRNRHSDDEDAAAVARALVQQEVLTRWQAAQLLAGRGSFFLGKYKLIELLGRGGMGSVFLGEHTTMNRRVALKILSRKVGKDPATLERFLSEARAIATLDHPNIVQAYSVDHEADRYFIVMEYVDGRDLQRIVEEDGPLDYETAADYIRQAADGLAHGHRRSMIHCGIKPSNLLVNNQGVVKIVDMGLTRVADDDEDADQDDERVLGTVDYLAPEQALKSPNFDHRADIYSLGCTLYFLLTGHPPFPEGLLHERLMKHQAIEPPDVCKECPDAPADLATLCRSMMAKRPEDRPQTAEEVSRALVDRRPPVRRPKPGGPPPKRTERLAAAAGLEIPSIDLGAKPKPNGPDPAAAEAAPAADKTGTPDPRRKKILLIAGIAAAVVVLALAVTIPLVIVSMSGDDEPPLTKGEQADSEAQPDRRAPKDGDLPANDDTNAEEPPAPDEPSTPELPVEDPPTEDPPPADPPATDPPAEDPPAEDPPAEDPPSEDPPSEEPPEAEPDPPKPEKKDPFRDLLAKADLLPPPGGSASAGALDAPVSLGQLHLEPNSSCDVELLGGENAVRGSRQFAMVRQGNEPNWLIHLSSPSSTAGSEPIELARVWRDGKSLQFQWRPEAGQNRMAKYLLNCGLKIRLDGQDRWMPLGRPDELEPLAVDLERGRKRQVIPADRLPESETLRLQITGLEGQFPEHEFKPSDTVAVGGSTDIVLKGQNLPDFKLRVSLAAKGRTTTIEVVPFYTLPGQQETPFRAKEAELVMKQALTLQQRMEAMVNQPGVDDPTKNQVRQQIQQLESGIEQLRALGTICQSIHKNGKISFRIFSAVDDQEVDLFVTKSADSGEPVEVDLGG